MSLIKVLVENKRCPLCKADMVHIEQGKLGHLWRCNVCGYAETLVCAGKWHPDTNRNKPKP